jgi:hypothetical protein
MPFDGAEMTVVTRRGKDLGRVVETAVIVGERTLRKIRIGNGERQTPIVGIAACIPTVDDV